MDDRKEIIAFSEFDAYLFGMGTNYESYRKLGAHPDVRDGLSGVYFAVWAPNARSVSVLTTSNGFNENEGWMLPAQGNAGVWEKFIPGAKAGDVYRFMVEGCDGVRRYKSDPYAFYAEKRPANASVVYPLDGYVWNDGPYMQRRGHKDIAAKPVTIYEVHLGSWKKDYRVDAADGFLGYRELADQLADYVQFMGYTHVELIGICEHPFDGSWGYQCTGFFAPTSRYGTPDDFRYFVDKMHSCGIGVILDWVPAHFPKDTFCMENFDGTHLYEYADPLRMEMPGWGTYAFDHGKNQVRSFLISSAMYWIREFHMDALRVDAVASMLTNNFDRGEYRPNIYGGVENLEGISFLKQLNDVVHRESGAFMVAEDSSIMEKITAPVDQGGLGFDFKWNLGWMNDTLKYFEKDPIYRRYHHGKLTYTYEYAFTENFVLVLSHDEVVHLKGSMLTKMPGGIENRLSGLKALYALQFTSPGKKLLFMGQEFAEDREWDEKRELDWHFASDFGHRDVMQCVRNLNFLYREYPCLYTDAKDPRTFEWVNGGDADRNIIAFIRRNPWNYDDAVLIVANLSPVMVSGYTVGVPEAGCYGRVFSTYDSLPGAGSPAEIGHIPGMLTSEGECDGRPYRLNYDLRPNEVIAIAFPKRDRAAEEKPKATRARKKAETVEVATEAKAEAKPKTTRTRKKAETAEAGAEAKAEA
ncbi:MAG: 1,4-alpha-glucan branching protein GlgB, partial [Clostridia bacterium]|nr:1,4-alpha-glucan branching protein GlgB [Clostridia bacterium]